MYSIDFHCPRVEGCGNPDLKVSRKNDAFPDVVEAATLEYPFHLFFTDTQ
jgi:hypothetical protein